MPDVKDPNERRRTPAGASGASSFLSNKTFLLVFLPILLVIIVITVVLLVRGLTEEGSAAPAETDKYVYVLPIPQRQEFETASSDNDPFAGGMSSITLEGIIYNPAGSSQVIITSSQTSYTLGIGDVIGDTDWTVKSITPDTVVIDFGGKEGTFTLAGAEEAAGISKAG